MISLSLNFLMEFTHKTFVDASTHLSMQASPLPPFLDTYSISLSFPRCKVLYIVITFLFLWSICQISTFCPFQESSRVLYKGNSLRIFPFDEISAAEIDFQMFFSFFWDTLFNLFLPSSIWWCPLLILSVNCSFPYIRMFCLFSGLAVLFLPLFFYFLFKLWARCIFLCQIRFRYPGSIFSLFVSKSPVLFMASMHITSLTFSLWFCKFIAPSTLPKYITEWYHCY